MARRTLTLVIDQDGRDKGKTFVLKEWSADRAERWAIRALLALGRSGAELPAGIDETAGMASLAVVGVHALAKLSPDDALPLLDEMMECVQYQHAPNLPVQALMAGDNSQIEEVRTRLWLRMKVLELHTGFSLPG